MRVKLRSKISHNVLIAILALIWLNSKNLSILIVFLMVLPILYTNTLEGIVPTGIRLDVVSLALLAILMLCGVVIFYRRSRRR